MTRPSATMPEMRLVRGWNWRQKIAWAKSLGKVSTHQFPETRMATPTEEGRYAGPHRPNATCIQIEEAYETQLG